MKMLTLVFRKMKFSLIVAMFLGSTQAFGYTTLDCIGTYKHPTKYTNFHLPITLKVKNNQIKRIENLSKTTSTLILEGPDQSKTRLIYVTNYQSGIFLGVLNRNWEPKAILLGEQMFVIEGRIVNHKPQVLGNLNCKVVPTLTKF